MSISRSQLGQSLICGSVAEDDEEEAAFAAATGVGFGGGTGFGGATVVPTFEFGCCSGLPRMCMIALSEISVWCSTGILTAALQTGHFPVLPALDSFAVKWCPFGHFNEMGTAFPPLPMNRLSKQIFCDHRILE